MVEFSLGESVYSVTRPKLRKWLDLEKIRGNAIESAEKLSDDFVLKVFTYLSALLDVPDEDIVNVPWYHVLEGYYLSAIECSVKLDLSIVQLGKKKTESSKLPDPWEYADRVWYSWVHTFAKAYGWKTEYVSELDVDDAFALMQEILLEEQFAKEWEWGLSEVAYKYDKASKKSTLQKLPRPEWMTRANRNYKESVEAPKQKVKINPAFVPPGVIVYDEQRDTTIDTKRDSSST